MIYIITGKPGAGKTTMAQRLKTELEQRSKKVLWFDGDLWRQRINNTDFSEGGRYLNIASAVKQAKEQEKEYNDIIFSFVMPDKVLRDFIRASFSESITIWIPGGKLWFGTEYQTPLPQEIGYYRR
jgi:adenylylsulfate kinase-like enzyme